MNRRLGLPAINIYKDDAGKIKGFATLSYEEPICAKAAVEHFDGAFHSSGLFLKRADEPGGNGNLLSRTGKEFQGQRLKVSMARRRPMMGGMRGGMPMRDGMMGRGGQ